MSKIRKSAKYKGFIIEQEAQTNKVSVVCKNTSQVLRDIADEIGMSYESDWGPYYLGSRLINFINGVDTTRKPKAETGANLELIQQRGSCKFLAHIDEAEHDGIIIRRKKNKRSFDIHYAEQRLPRLLEEIGKDIGLSDLSGDVETLAKRIIKHATLSQNHPVFKLYRSDVTPRLISDEDMTSKYSWWEAIKYIDFKDGDLVLRCDIRDLSKDAGFEYKNNDDLDYEANQINHKIKFINFLNGIVEPEEKVYSIDGIKRSTEYKGLLIEYQPIEGDDKSIEELTIIPQDKLAFLRAMADCAKFSYDPTWDEKELALRFYDFMIDRISDLEEQMMSRDGTVITYDPESDPALEITIPFFAEDKLLQQVMDASGFERNPEWSKEYAAYRLMIFLHGFKTDEQIWNAIFGDDHEEYMLPREDQYWWFNLSDDLKYLLLSNLREDFEKFGYEFPSWDGYDLGRDYGEDIYGFYNTVISAYLQDFIIGYRDENGEYDYESADLSYLSVPNNVYDIDDLSPLARLKNIKHFSFAEWDGHIGEEMLESLSKFTHLERLNLSNNEVDEDALNKLASLTNLERLYLEDCGIDEDSEVIEALREALPNCEIIL